MTFSKPKPNLNSVFRRRIHYERGKTADRGFFNINYVQMKISKSKLSLARHRMCPFCLHETSLGKSDLSSY